MGGPILAAIRRAEIPQSESTRLKAETLVIISESCTACNRVSVTLKENSITRENLRACLTVRRDSPLAGARQADRAPATDLPMRA